MRTLEYKMCPLCLENVIFIDNKFTCCESTIEEAINNALNMLSGRIYFGYKENNHPSIKQKRKLIVGYYLNNTEKTIIENISSGCNRKSGLLKGMVNNIKLGDFCPICSSKYYMDVQHRNGWKVSRQTHPVVDHIIPYSYSNCNHNANLRIICNVCNMIKGSRVFDSISEIDTYILRRRSEKGYWIERNANLYLYNIIKGLGG